MAKPKRVLGELFRFRGLIGRYTGRRLLMAPLRPIARLTPSPTSILLRVLKL